MDKSILWMREKRLKKVCWISRKAPRGAFLKEAFFAGVPIETLPLKMLAASIAAIAAVAAAGVLRAAIVATTVAP